MVNKSKKIDDQLIMQIRNFSAKNGLLKGVRKNSLEKLSNFKSTKKTHIIFNNEDYFPQRNLESPKYSFDELSGIEIVMIKNFKDLRVIEKIIAKERKDTIESLINNAIFQDGIFIKVKANQKISKPLRIQLENSDNVADKMIVYLEEGSEVSIHDVLNPKLKFRNSTTYFILGKDAKLDYSYHQDIDKNAVVFDTKYLDLGPGAEMNAYITNFGTKKLKHRYFANLDENAISNVSNIFYTNENQQYDLYAGNCFNKRNGGGEILVKGVLKGDSRVAIEGMINIKRNGGGTNTYLTEDVLMLDDKCRVDAIPSLEIDTNDVRASHGVSVSKLQDENIFYAVSRGLSKNEAEKMIVEGFLHEVSEKSDINSKFQDKVLQSIRDKN